MWVLDHKGGWVLKNWYFWIVVLEKTLESPLDSKEIKPANPKGNQPWIFIGRTDDEAEAPIFWPPDVKSWLIRKDPDAGNDWRQEEKGQHRMRWLDGITDSMDMSLTSSRNWWWIGKPGLLQSMGVAKQQLNWTEFVKLLWIIETHSALEYATMFEADLLLSILLLWQYFICYLVLFAMLFILLSFSH